MPADRRLRGAHGSLMPPMLSPAQKKASEGTFPPVPKVCFVTGGTGFVGQRLVEMLVQRGADRVVSFDIVPKPASAWDDPRIEWIVGDITDADALYEAMHGADCVWHNAAAVGPFHPQELYKRVNYDGTMNVIAACKKHKIRKLVFSSSPSTRFDGSDVDGVTEDEMPDLPLNAYLQDYAKTKAEAEVEISRACCTELMTVSVAPHQVYGPRDNLFMPNILEAAGTGKLRIFAHPRTGNGKNKVCFTHVDNYAHGLIIGERALYPGSPALGKFYVVTDGDSHSHPDGYGFFWEEIDKTIMLMGFDSLWQKFKLPYWLLMPIAYLCNIIGWFIGMKLKLNPFNVMVLTMHRWFDISAAKTDLKFEPVIKFTEGWSDMGEWFKATWLPSFGSTHRTLGIAKQSEDKINIQAGRY